MSAAPVLPGAEPFAADGGPHGALVLHGFTGSPQSVRGMARAFAAQGLAVELPLLPGHGTSVADMATTTWPDWSEAVLHAYRGLAARSERVVVAGLSMGATLACWLAARQPEIAGLVLVNGAFQPLERSVTDALDAALAAGVETLPGVAGDIAAEGVTELAYDAVPPAAMRSVADALEALQDELPRIRCPVLLLTSPQDHVVPAASSDHLAARVAGPVERVCLERSYHVATLDHDRDRIEARAVEFALRVTQDA